MKTETNITAKLGRLACVAFAVAGTSCVSLDQIAPRAVALSSQPSSQLTLGREIYVTRCAKCHAPEPVRKYSTDRWDEILPEMAEETKLTSAEADAVREYVMTVLGKSVPSV